MTVNFSHIGTLVFVDTTCVETTYNVGVNVINNENKPIQLKHFGFIIGNKRIHFTEENDQLITVNPGQTRHLSQPDSYVKSIITKLNLPNYEDMRLTFFVQDVNENYCYCENCIACRDLM